MRCATHAISPTGYVQATGGMDGGSVSVGGRQLSQQMDGDGDMDGDTWVTGLLASMHAHHI